ncbi:unnamed protein product [Penicillium egyptiacum]|uniref:Glucose-methanol-choline oxidoreductase N-terminal domain-containing protein n=1 Tax=Penicillium egyptiacum TaxID=1303716 RepID=A0A9W4KCT6_9EURO|nr:unnamed protein product [Penicillium egyptiacum]
MQPVRDLLTSAWKSTGQPINDNILDGEMVGLTYSVNSIYKGRRSGSFLCVADKSNITILPQVHSKKLIINDADKTCKGVTVITGSGQELNLYATREVVVSQGVFESPKLLMLSGIGPSAELKKHHIPTIVNNPHVSQHLLDHPGVPFVLRVKDGFGMDDYVLHKGTPHNNQAIQSYQNNHGGPLGSGFLEMVGFPELTSIWRWTPSTARLRPRTAIKTHSARTASLTLSSTSSVFSEAHSSDTIPHQARATT